MSDHPITRPAPTRHLYLVPALTADELDAHSEPSAGDNADPSWTWLLDGLDTPTTTERLHLTEILNRWNLTPLADTAAHVVTKLVSNTKPPVVLTIRMDKTTRPPALEISVTNGDSTAPIGREPSEHGGIGLSLTHGLADLNTTAHDHGKSLAARIPCTDSLCA